MYSASGHVTFEVEDVWGSELIVELAIRLDTVEAFCMDRNRAVFDRDHLRDWLSEPVGVLTADDVTWACVGGRIGLTIDPLMHWWPLSPLVLLELMGRI